MLVMVALILGRNSLQKRKFFNLTFTAVIFLIFTDKTVVIPFKNGNSSTRPDRLTVNIPDDWS